jgi:para-nitrobenzyl esterase
VNISSFLNFLNPRLKPTFIPMIVPLMLLGLAGLTAAAAPIVQSSQGAITGGQCPSAAVERFLGIPYAEPPVRFAAPQPYNGTYNTTFTTQPPSCIQFGTTFLEYGPTSEDW